MGFASASAVTPAGEGRFRAEIPDGWQQGRGAFGGLVLGTMLRAVEAAEGHASRRTRTLMGDLCGPVVPGAIEVTTTLLRRGNNQSNWRAELVQNGEVLAVVSVVRSTARRIEDAPRIVTPPPERVPFESVAPVPLGQGIGPAFAKHYEYRPHGALPFTGGPEPLATGWVREREPLDVVDAPAMTARLDAYYPALYAMTRAPRPCATIAFASEYLVDPATLDPRVPLHYVARDVAIADGFFLELRELWHEGAIVALNQQTFAVLK